MLEWYAKMCRGDMRQKSAWGTAQGLVMGRAAVGTVSGCCWTLMLELASVVDADRCEEVYGKRKWAWGTAYEAKVSAEVATAGRWQ